MDQIVQMAGALMILTAFVAGQRGALSAQSLPYLLLNFVGSVLLFAVALAGRDWGFVLLEGVWAIVSGWGLIGLALGRRPGTSG